MRSKPSLHARRNPTSLRTPGETGMDTMSSLCKERACACKGTNTVMHAQALLAAFHVKCLSCHEW